MKKFLAIVLAALCLSAFAACGSDYNSSGNTTETAGSSDGPSVVAQADKTISTPYADLRVTSDFYANTDNKVTSEEPYVLTFYTKEGTELFSLHFDDKTDNVVGTLKQKDKNVVIYTKLAALDSKAANYDRDCKYQEEINVIIESLEEDYDFTPHKVVSGKEQKNDSKDAKKSKKDTKDTSGNDTQESEDVETFAIKTSVTTLKYPKIWKDKVDVKVSDEKVEFSSDDTPLFDLIFKEGKGYLLGTYKDTPIYVNYYEVEGDEKLAMIDDANIILQNLMKDKNFKVNTTK